MTKYRLKLKKRPNVRWDEMNWGICRQKVKYFTTYLWINKIETAELTQTAFVQSFCIKTFLEFFELFLTVGGTVFPVLLKFNDIAADF